MSGASNRPTGASAGHPSANDGTKTAVPARIVFLGPPGAGKGTQAIRLAQTLGVPHISTGDMLRAAAASGSEFGRRVKAIFDAGQLVPDDVMEGVVAERLAAPDCALGFLLDGYPRTLPQAYFLAGVLAGTGRRIDHVVLIEVPRDELVRRMAARGRSDDTREAIENRLQDYDQKTRPLTEFYGSRGLVRRVEGTGTMDDVAARLSAAVGAADR